MLDVRYLVRYIGGYLMIFMDVALVGGVFVGGEIDSDRRWLLDMFKKDGSESWTQGMVTPLPLRDLISQGPLKNVLCFHHHSVRCNNKNLLSTTQDRTWYFVSPTILSTVSN